MSAPSLLNLFNRGRYFRPPRASEEDDSDETRAARRECERFAMAAIGLVLKYDSTFRSHFLERVLGVPSTEQPENVGIEIEPIHWADLRLTWTNRTAQSVVHLIEGKLGAGLQDKQNYARPEFVAADGYGRLIAETYPAAASRMVHYTVLGFSGQLGRPVTKSIACAQRDWRDLESGWPSSLMCHDLAECLAGLGVKAFALQQTNNMKIVDDMGGATNAWIILDHVCERAGIQRKYTKPEIGMADDGWHFGWNLIPKDGNRVVEGAEEKVRRSVELTNVVQPRAGDPFGWIGYERVDGRTVPAVWFYCGNQAAGEAVKQKLEPAFQVEIDRQHALLVRKPVADTAGDRDWFVSVLATP